VVQSKIVMYATSWCPYCSRARRLFQLKQVEFEEIDIDDIPGARSTMVERSGGRSSVPQIFIGDKHVGGSDDLYALDKSGGLDPLLNLGA